MGDEDLFATPDEPVPGVQWWQGPVECGICGNEWRAVVPIEEGHHEPFVSLECPDCEHMAGHPE